MSELVVTLKGRELSRVPITKTDTAIGRDPACEVRIDNLGVSRTHAVVRYRNLAFRVFDHGSANGLMVNGERVDGHPLRDGDEIQVGKFVVLYVDRDLVGALEDNSARADLEDTRRKSLADATTHLTPAEIAKISSLPPPPEELVFPVIERVRPLTPEPTQAPSKLVLVLAIALGVALVVIMVLVGIMIGR
jgi:pSer/pThr/pTyr-binding forkhead associated (FHA) protein